MHGPPRLFRVATYNVHACVGRDGRHDPARVAAVIADDAVDELRWSHRLGQPEIRRRGEPFLHDDDDAIVGVSNATAVSTLVESS